MTRADQVELAVVACPPGRGTSALWLIVVGLSSAALCLPFLDSVWWFGDEGVALLGAERLLHGEMLYRDFFEVLPPGPFIVLLGLLDQFCV